MNFEIIGVIASVIVLCSAIFRSTDKRKNILMRLLNAVGSFAFVIYGFLIGSASIVVLNIIMIGVCCLHASLLIKDLKEVRIHDKPTVDSIDVWINRSDDPNMMLIKHGVIGVDWAGSYGWGRWEMLLDEDGVPHIYSEHMDKDDDKAFSEAILKKVLEEAIIEE